MHCQNIAVEYYPVNVAICNGDVTEINPTTRTPTTAQHNDQCNVVVTASSTVTGTKHSAVALPTLTTNQIRAVITALKVGRI